MNYVMFSETFQRYKASYACDLDVKVKEKSLDNKNKLFVIDAEEFSNQDEQDKQIKKIADLLNDPKVVVLGSQFFPDKEPLYYIKPLRKLRNNIQYLKYSDEGINKILRDLFKKACRCEHSGFIREAIECLDKEQDKKLVNEEFKNACRRKDGEIIGAFLQSKFFKQELNKETVKNGFLHVCYSENTSFTEYFLQYLSNSYKKTSIDDAIYLYFLNRHILFNLISKECSDFIVQEEINIGGLSLFSGSKNTKVVDLLLDWVIERSTIKMSLQCKELKKSYLQKTKKMIASWKTNRSLYNNFEDFGMKFYTKIVLEADLKELLSLQSCIKKEFETIKKTMDLERKEQLEVCMSIMKIEIKKLISLKNESEIWWQVLQHMNMCIGFTMLRAFLSMVLGLLRIESNKGSGEGGSPKNEGGPPLNLNLRYVFDEEQPYREEKKKQARIEKEEEKRKIRLQRKHRIVKDIDPEMVLHVMDVKKKMFEESDSESDMYITDESDNELNESDNERIAQNQNKKNKQICYNYM